MIRISPVEADAAMAARKPAKSAQKSGCEFYWCPAGSTGSGNSWTVPAVFGAVLDPTDASVGSSSSSDDWHAEQPAKNHVDRAELNKN